MGSILTERAEMDSATGLPIGVAVSTNPAKRPEAASLQGQYVYLEPLNPETHGEALWQATGGSHNGDLWRYMAEGPFAVRTEFDDAMKAASIQTDPIFYAILDSVSKRSVGRCSYLNIRPAHGVIEAGHLLFSTELQRTRGATEALYLLAKYAFEDLGYRRYEWKCNALNAKSRQAAERLGFTFEGVFRQHMIVKGRNRDTAWFSILDDEWPTIRRAYERWLAQENFDENGRQRQRLADLMGDRT